MCWKQTNSVAILPVVLSKLEIHCLKIGNCKVRVYLKLSRFSLPSSFCIEL